jgi:hypothetical protein
LLALSEQSKGPHLSTWDHPTQHLGRHSSMVQAKLNKTTWGQGSRKMRCLPAKIIRESVVF